MMDTVIDFMGNPVFGALILLLIIILLVRQGVFVVASRASPATKLHENSLARTMLFACVAAALFAVAGATYAMSPSVRNDFAFLRTGPAADNTAISNHSELCFKRIACYPTHAARQRCAESDAFDKCVQERVGSGASDATAGCGDFKVLYDDSRVSNTECMVRNAASVLISASSRFDRSARN